jgi:FkbM family methyltransferase
MSIKNNIKKIIRIFGIDIKKYNVAESKTVRFGSRLSHHKIDLVLDIGANIGNYGEFIRSTGYKGIIISFEPLSNAHQTLVLKAKGDRNWQIAPPMALGDKEDLVEINISGNSSSSSLLNMLPSHVETAPESKYIGKEKVAVKRLDAIDDINIKRSNHIYLKIDTQGYEMLVLLGANGIMDKIVGIQIEMSIIPLYDGQALYQELLTWLEKQGFEIWDIEPVLYDDKSGRMLQFDGIFYRK